MTLIIEIMQSYEKYLSYKLLCLCFFVTSALLVMYQIFAINIILELMIGTVRQIILWIFVLSALGLLYRLIVQILLLIVKKFYECKDKRRTLEELSHISSSEKLILNYVRSGGSCGKWVSENDAAVLMLLSKKLLTRVTEKTQLIEWKTDGKLEQGILVMLSPIVRELPPVK